MSSTASGLLQLQRAVGNRAVAAALAGRPMVQRDADMAATLSAKAASQIQQAAAARTPQEGADSESHDPPSPEQVATEKRKQRAALSGTVTPPDTSAASSEATAAAGDTKIAAAEPPASTPGPGVPPVSPPTAAMDATPAQDAAARATASVALVAAQQAPAAPEPVVAPERVQTIEAGGRQVPGNPVMQSLAAGLAGRIQSLRSGAHQVRTAAVEARAQAHRSTGLIESARSAVAESQTGVSTLRSHTEQRRTAAAQARSASNVAHEKQQTVAAGAPDIAGRSAQGSAMSSPMASESQRLAAENTSHQPEDPEAAGQSAEQGSKLTKAGHDLAMIDSAITGTQGRAQQLQTEAATAATANAAADGKIAQTEAVLQQTDARTAEIDGQNQAATAQLEGFAAQPAAHLASADQMAEEGQSLHEKSVVLEARLHAAEQNYLTGMAAMPPRVPAAAIDASVQRVGYEDRTHYDPARAVTGALPPWLTGEDPPNAAEAARHHTQEEQRRAAELAEIDRECQGNFGQLSSSRKAGIALRLAGRNLWHGIGETNLPKFGLNLLRGFIDPRASLMGVVNGLGMIVSGGANLFSAQQWARDPLGNLLKSSADIATGVTIVLGSIAGLAVSIGIILTAVAIIGSIFSFGAVGLALAPIIAFCATVASTVGPWAITAAAVALTLHALVFIKNLIAAATADTSAELQQQSDKMTEDAQNAGNMALQIGMAKAMEAGGRMLAGRGGAAPVEGAAGDVGSGGSGAPEPAPAVGGPEPAPAPAPAAGPETAPAATPAPAPERAPAPDSSPAPAEQAPAEQAPAEQAPAEQAPAEQAPPESSNGSPEQRGPAGRPRPEAPLDPPRNSDGSINFPEWEARLKTKGVAGDIDARIARAAAGDADAVAELRTAERYADAGYQVDPAAPQENAGVRNPDLDTRFPSGEPPANQPFKVEVKNRATNPMSKNSLNTDISTANDQIRSGDATGPRRGDIVVDASEAPAKMTKAEVERLVGGKMRGAPDAPGARLSSIDYLEVVWRDPADGFLKRTFMVRTADGQVNGPFTEKFPGQ